MPKNKDLQRNNIILFVAFLVIFFALIGAGTNWSWFKGGSSPLEAQISPNPYAHSRTQIVSPADGALLPKRGMVNISTKTPTTSSIIVTVIIEGIVKKTCKQTPTCNFSWDVSGLPTGSYDIVVTSTDMAGNVDSSKVTVRKQ